MTKSWRSTPALIGTFYWLVISERFCRWFAWSVISAHPGSKERGLYSWCSVVYLREMTPRGTKDSWARKGNTILLRNWLHHPISSRPLELLEIRKPHSRSSLLLARVSVRGSGGLWWISTREQINHKIRTDSVRTWRELGELIIKNLTIKSYVSPEPPVSSCQGQTRLRRVGGQLYTGY